MRPILPVLAALAASTLHAETGYDAWLRYAPLDPAVAQQYRTLPANVIKTGGSAILDNAQAELIRGVRGMLGRTLRVANEAQRNEPAIVLGTIEALRHDLPLPRSGTLRADGFLIRSVRSNAGTSIVVAGQSDRGVLYGVFALLRKLGAGEAIASLDDLQNPYAPVRWVNHWDNLDGSIERGYGGRSIFWENGHARADLTRVNDYARLLASLGINGCSINNVNANPRVLSPELLRDVARIADVFRPWGIRIAISVDFGSPKTLGGLDTFDPVDPRVVAWWKEKIDEVYTAVPDLAGVVMKADSEGRVGPSAYGRTHADATNVVARALQPHNGIVFYRGFVYDHHMDWRNLKNDRARAAYDNFKELDGKFADNAIIQIKHGPIDFQVREPASPLFAALEKTNQAIELQITQEYFGQARHTVFLVPMWKEALDFDMQARGAGRPVKALAAGRTFTRPTGGIVGVSNVGLDQNWFGNHLSQANLYGFGRLAWNPDLTVQRIADEWTRLSFGNDPAVTATINKLQLGSWRTYENYTGPLGLQTLTDIVGNHYGVAVEASERNGWGQWHRADEQGVGMDRTVATGTGFIGQYRAPVARMFESLSTCPDDLVLFMHHVPYDYKLHSGKTVIQYLYDSHYEGAARVKQYARDWKALRGRVDDQRYREVLSQLEYQADQAIVWRDAVTNWFHRESKIDDALGRVGRHPDRTEAESANLEGYVPRDVSPWETASNGKAIACTATSCTAIFKYSGRAGWQTVRVQYFDIADGVAQYRMRVNDQIIDSWSAGERLPAKKLDSTSSSRRTIRGVALRPGDEIRIEGKPDRNDPAALDYIEIGPDEQ